MKKSKYMILGAVAAMQLTLTTVWGTATQAPAAGSAIEEPVIASQSAVLINEKTGEILYEKNGDMQCYPASITKLLTALITVENCDLTDIVIFSHDAVYDVEAGSGNPLQLEAGDKLTVEECLYAMILESSNQAANALAEHVAGSLDAFAIYMDTKLEELGCSHSTFVNPSGLNDEAQMTTAEDMAVIARAAFSNPQVLEICSAKKYSLPATLNNPEGYELHMEHQLLSDDTKYQYEYAVAGKTGYTSIAGNTLVTDAAADDEELIAVVMKSDQTHYEDTISLFQYGFDYLERQEQLAAAGETTTDELGADRESEESTEEEAGIEKQEKVSFWRENNRLVIVGGILMGGLALLYGMYAHVQMGRARKRRIRARKNRSARAVSAKKRSHNARRQHSVN